MSTVFKAELRKIGNSSGVIIPDEVLKEMNLHEGDSINVCIPSAAISKRNTVTKEGAGKYKNTSRFQRDKVDRY